jgi:hypothetical protein
VTDLNVYGVALSRGRIQRATTAHVRRGVPDYWRVAARQEGVQADGATALEVGTLQLPRSWRRTQGELDRWPEDQLPALIFGSPGLSDEGVRRDGEGKHEGTWVFSWTAVVSGRDDDVTGWLVGIYTLALRLLFLQQPLIEGLPVTKCSYADEAYDGLPFRRSRSLMAGTVVFELGLKDLGSARGGPVDPAENPIPDPGPWPVVENTGLDLDRSAL